MGTTADGKYPLKRLSFAFHGSTWTQWQFSAGHPTAQRRGSAVPDRSEVDTCAYCHSRRATLAPHSRPGQPLASTHQLALLEEDLYFSDGQQKDEVFEYGSFLQSKMFQAGVTCSHCHEPHSGQLRAKGNTLCAQCHQSDVFDTIQHHGHPYGTTGSQCINCHMPARVYMQVDTRRDHRFLIPRPDLFETLETPSPCTDCHREHTSKWAAQQIKQWHPDRIDRMHFAEVLQMGRRWQPGAPAQLEHLFTNMTQPAIVRATALQLLARYPGQRLSRVTQITAMDADPLLRHQTAATLPYLPPAQANMLAGHLLADSILTVRIEAAKQLLELSPELIRSVNIELWQHVLEELRIGLEAQHYRAEALLGLATLAQHRGDMRTAETLLQEVIIRQPHYAPGWISLSEILRQQGYPKQAYTLLLQALDKAPNTANLYYALAMAEVRMGKMTNALMSLARAVQLAPQNPEYIYAQAIALHETNHQEQALEVLMTASQHFPGHADLLNLMVQYATIAQRWALARQAITQRHAIEPEEPAPHQFQLLSP